MEQNRDPDARPPSSSPNSSAAASRRVFWSAFLVLLATMLLWAVGNPPMASPDEPAHVVKAAAVVRGELTGVPDPGGPGSGVVDVPALYAFSMAIPGCFAFHSDLTAKCIPNEPSDLTTTTKASTWVVRNNPMYYAIVGLPTLLPPGQTSFYLMRAISAALCALVLAWGMRALTELRRTRLIGLGILAAMTPMVLFLGSTVNPSGLEICSALALWVSLLALLRSPDPEKLPVRMAGISVLAVLLANSRGLSPLFLLVITVVAVAISPWTNFVTALRDRRSWPWLAVTLVGSLASLAWIAVAGTLSTSGSTPTGISFLAGLKNSIVATPIYVTNMIGQFGWMDTALPQWMYLLLISGIAFPIVLALLLAPRRRDTLAVAGVGAIAIGLPILIHAWQAKNVGLIWQGRYSLPLMVGLPLVAGFVARDGIRSITALHTRAVLIVPAVTLVVGQFSAFAYNLHRYVRGTAASWFVPSAADWVPPAPVKALLAGYAVALVLLVVLMDRVTRRTETDVRIEEPNAHSPVIDGRPLAPAGAEA